MARCELRTLRLLQGPSWEVAEKGQLTPIYTSSCTKEGPKVPRKTHTSLHSLSTSTLQQRPIPEHRGDFRVPGRSWKRVWYYLGWGSQNSEGLEHSLEEGSGSVICGERALPGESRGSGQRSLLLGFKCQSDYTTPGFNLI